MYELSSARQLEAADTMNGTLSDALPVPSPISLTLENLFRNVRRPCPVSEIVVQDKADSRFYVYVLFKMDAPPLCIPARIRL